jgi:hypothetical protein
MTKCLYCPGTDIFGIGVDKAYRRGSTSYTREDGEYWCLGEFDELDSDNLPGILSGGDLDMDICLDCYRIQKFELTPEIKQNIIDAHISKGRNPLQVEREKQARLTANKQERESRQHLYDEWRKDQPERYYLYLFYKKEDQGSLDAINRLINTLNKCKANVGIVKLEWSSTEAYKPKIRYSIQTTAQCCLTDKSGGDIVRLSLPESAAQLVKYLDALGYHGEARNILPASEFYLGDSQQ